MITTSLSMKAATSDDSLEVTFHSRIPTKATLNGMVYTINRKADALLKRSKDTLHVILTSDTLKKTIILKPIKTFHYYFPSYHGELEKYRYQKDVYIDFQSEDSIALKFPGDKKGQIDLMISVPFANNFYFHPPGESYKFGSGFFGTSVGIGYHYKTNRYINMLASIQIQYEIPIPVGIDYFGGVYEFQRSKNLCITDNYQINRFTLGYGLDYSWNTWSINYYGDDYNPPTQVPYSKTNESIGLILNGYFKINNHLHLGLIYRPDFLTVYPYKKIEYGHSVSVDVAWKFRIKTRK